MNSPDVKPDRYKMAVYIAHPESGALDWAGNARLKGRFENLHHKISGMAKAAGKPICAVITAQMLFDDAFSQPHESRSDAYKAGVLAVLQFKIAGEYLEVPYPGASAEADAFLAGTDEGHRIWARWKEELGPETTAGAL